MSDVLMRASRRDKKRIEQDKLPQKSETPVKKVRDLDTRGFLRNTGRALEHRDKKKVNQNMRDVIGKPPRSKVTVKKPRGD
jgi:hypothetical protein